MNNLTNLDEDNFNKSLLTLLNGQQDLQKQSFNLIQDMTHRHEYDNLMRDIPIYYGKNMVLAGWLVQIEKVVSVLITKSMNWLQLSQPVYPTKCWND